MSLKKKLIDYAYSRGASLVGIAGPEVYDDYLKEVEQRLGETKATHDDFMVNDDALTYFNKLSDPGKDFKDLKSIIILGIYAYDEYCDYKSTIHEEQGKIARTYPYYPVLRIVCEQVVDFLKHEGYEAIDGQQIPLKYVAQKTGLGTYGWNSLLHTKEFGSYVGLRCILTNVEFSPDTFSPPEPSCDTCGRCIKACPTGALYAPYKVNPKLCLNPISRKDDVIPPGIRDRMGNWICGCDICQEVCPTNRKLEPREPDTTSGYCPGKHASHRTLGDLTRIPDLVDIVKGNKNNIITRNAIIALGNTGSLETKDELENITPGDERGLGEYISHAIDQINTRLQI